ncbi:MULTISPECIES: helix-turn-helix domain-containing protein [Olivibacter]|uniref:Helix-turn-helix domain-containing protein n=1 Tax=Olivibacter jilunii TaxID=985016 RepID=A0ABW6AWW9_9SPHI
MNIDAVIQVVADEYGVAIEDMRSSSRNRKVSEARHVVCYLLRKERYSKLGVLLNRHRTTILNSINVISDILTYDKKLENRLQTLIKDINNNRLTTQTYIQEEMTIKLNIDQLEGVTLLVTAALNAYKPDNLGESLLYEIVDKVNDRLKAKIKKRQFENRVGTSITLSSIEAKAFHCWYNQIVTIFQEDSYRYERSVAASILNQIDKVYA